MSRSVTLALLPFCVAIAGCASAFPSQASVPPRARVATVALRVHHMDKMLTFYAEVFGARFRQVDTFGIASQFADLAGVTLKFVPIRESIDCAGYPVHQIGLTLPDEAAMHSVMAMVQQHGGRVEGPPRREGGRLHAAIRDPDCNTIELYAGR